jgi:hypothetical protein
MSNKATRFPKPDIGSQELTEEYIRQRAYHRFEQRGEQHGHDLEDWVAAEAEIFGRNHKGASDKDIPSRAA